MTSRTALNSPDSYRDLQTGGVRKAALILLAVAAAGTAIYGFGARSAAPWLVERWLAEYRAAAPGRAASVEAVRFDPFTLVAELDRLELTDGPSQSTFRADRVRAGFSVRTPFERRPVLKVLSIERPSIEVPAMSALPAWVRRGLGAMRVERFELTGGSLVAGRGTERRFELTSLDLSLSGVDARAGDGPAGDFALRAQTPAGAVVSADGTLQSGLASAAGRLGIDGADLAEIAARLGGGIEAAAPTGRLNLMSALRATALLDAPSIELDDARIELVDVMLAPAPDVTVSLERAEARATLALAAGNGGTPLSGRIEIPEIALSIRDAGTPPARTFDLEQAAALVTRDADGALSVDVAGRLGGAEASLTVRQADETGLVSLHGEGLPVTVVSAYAADMLGRGLAAGVADLDLRYSFGRGRLDGELAIVLTDPEFMARPNAPYGADGNAPGSAARDSLELAAALLEDADGVVAVEIRFAGTATRVRDAVADALRARLAAVTETPFDALAPLVAGGGGAVDAVPFGPGDPALGDRALEAVAQLAEILKARPKLGLRLHAGYEADVDRDALARRQIQLHVLLATAGPDAQARPRPIDFGSARVHDVLDEFAGERLPEGRLADIARRFDCGGAVEALCRRGYYAAVFDALVANEEIAPTALTRLGRFRAQSIVDALRGLDVAVERVEVVADAATVDSAFGIGLPVELTALEAEN